MRVVGPAQNSGSPPAPNERMRDERTSSGALREARDDPRISHPHTHLIVTTPPQADFRRRRRQLDELRDVPMLARFHTHRPPATGAPSVVPSVDVFRGCPELPGLPRV